MFNGISFIILNASNHTKCVSLNDQQYMTQPTFFNCYPIEYNQRLCYYPFAVNLDRYVGHCNTFNDLANRTYVSNKRKDLNLHYVYMITAENESKTIAIHMSCECTSIFDGKAYDLNQK